MKACCTTRLWLPEKVFSKTLQFQSPINVRFLDSSRLFQSKANLNNVRLGRGLYNSFNAKSPIQRWPLDHYFVTDEFAFLELERLPDFNSDHFPMFAKLVLKGQ